MRVSSPGIGSPDESGSLSFDGRTVPVAASDTVASAMVAAGELGNRRGDSGDLRGVWCGMGVCHECAVTVDHREGALACVTPARSGQTVETQSARRRVPTEAAAPRPESELSPDVLVIGAGPAGLAAARDLAAAGLEVLLIDERKKLGGQFYKQPDPALPIDEANLDGQYTAGRRLIEAARRSGARLLLGASVWAAFDADRLLARSDSERWVIRPRRVVLATGAYERGVPIPGWTLPGVMTTGAGQTLLRSYQVAPGARVLVAGNGPLNIQLAAELAMAGVDVVGLVEAASFLSPARASAAR
jgi:NADPH-dependent 2,4-dienoyl-CoA reductase/sulfur reductase-like enzyme